MHRFHHFLSLVFVCGLLTACTPKPLLQDAQMAPQPLVVVPIGKNLAVGDALDVVVTGEADLSGTYVVASDGTIKMPLVGYLKVAQLSEQEASALITQSYAQGYLVKPDVNVRRRVLAQGACLQIPLCVP